MTRRPAHRAPEHAWLDRLPPEDRAAVALELAGALKETARDRRMVRWARSWSRLLFHALTSWW